MYIFGIYLDLLSFWIGFIAATVVWALIALLRPMAVTIWKDIQKQRAEARAKAGSGIEDNYRKLTHRKAQSMHLASSLFALDEIIEQPLLLAPPPQIEPGMPPYTEDIVGQSLPYMPAWPEMGSYYHAPCLTLPQALSGGVNVIVHGQAGTGKTTALAYLTALIAKQSPLAGDLKDRTPFLIHAADLGLPIPESKNPLDLLEPIIALVESSTPIFDRARVPVFVQNSFESGRAILLIDGVDEIPPSMAQDLSAYLKVLLKAYPKTRVAAAGSTEYADGLINLGFAPMAILPWNNEQQKSFLARWADLWERYVSMEAWAQTTQPIDPLILTRWLETDTHGLTPLEFTLKVWSAYAGDARGPRAIDAIEAHIRRLTPSDIPAEALETLGMQVHLSSQTIFDANSAKAWVKSFELPEALEQDQAAADGNAPVSESVEGADDQSKNKKKSKSKKAAAPQASLLTKLVSSGLLAMHGGSKMRFAHPVFGGLLAGRGFAGRNPEPLLQQTSWGGRTLAMQYVAAFGDATVLARGLLATKEKPLHRPLFIAARLLKDAPRNAPWRGSVMSALAEILQDEDAPLGLRGQAIAAFAFSGDPSAAALFRSLLQMSSQWIKRLAAFGAGAAKDTKAVEQIIPLIGDPSPGTSMAACLALASIGTRQALEAIAHALISGSEPLRRTAAEALANNAHEGHEALREGIQAEDILLRHAIVYGLARVREEWAGQLLEKVQTEDQQWVVRNAAVEILSARERVDARVPRTLTAPSETPWLIEFAGKFGMGVTPGQPATDIFLLALKGDSFEHRMAALNYLRYIPSEGVFGAMYNQLYGDDVEMREAIFASLQDMAMSGAPLPDPFQFGLG
jgi:hypothetical protein